MSRNSIGQFIAALRRANGMTQQDVADRLNVSNKAVSRWERDECAPDISLIPSIAEMFGVTCDELLKGQRILDSSSFYENKQEDSQEGKQDKKDPRVQKQVKSLVNRTLSKFKTLNYISVAISVVGMICMFGISYGFFRPIIALGVTLLLEVGALFLAVVAVSKIKAVKADNELFEEADDSLIAKFNNTLSSFSFASFFAVLTVVLFGVPLVMHAHDAYSVLNLNDYFRLYVGGIVLILVLVFLLGRKLYYRLITGCPAAEASKDPAGKKVLIMDIVQFGLCILAFLITMVSMNTYYENNSFLWLVLNIASIVCGVALLGFTVLFLIRNKESIKSLILPAIRNIFLVEAFGMLTEIYQVWWSYKGNDPDLVYLDHTDPSMWEKMVDWRPEYIWYAAVYAMLVFAVYYVVAAIINRVKKSKNK